MGVQIANVDLSAAVVGTTGTVSWQNIMPPQTLAQQMRPHDVQGRPTIHIFNESRYLIKISLPVSGQSFTLTSGRWVNIPVPPNEISFTYLVQGGANGTALFANLLVDFYRPGELVYELGVLGNSPIGISSLTTSTNLVNDGSATNTQIIESTPSGAGTSGVSVTNDGQAIFGGSLIFGAGSSSSTTQRGTLRHTTTGNGYVLMPNLTGAAMGGVLQAWDGAAVVSVFGVGTLASTPKTQLANDGSVAVLAGQATAGSFGVSPLVASVTQQHITVTTQQTLVSITPTPGIYEVSGYISVLDVTSPAALNLAMQYTDKVGGEITRPLVQPTNVGAGSAIVLDGTTRSVPNSFSILAQGLEIVSGTLTITYQNSTGTPNDFVSIYVKRLA